MINLTKAMTAAGVGIADELIERRGGTISGWRYVDAARLAAVLLGYGAGEFMPRYGAVGETVAIAATPLFVKTLAAKFMTGGSSSKDFAPRDISARIRNWVPSDLGNVAGGYRAMRVTS